MWITTGCSSCVRETIVGGVHLRISLRVLDHLEILSNLSVVSSVFVLALA